MLNVARWATVTAVFEFVVPESKLEKTEHGLVPKGEGWFVLNMRDAEWRHVDGRGAVCIVGDDFEGERRFEQLGVNPFVLRPGEPMAMYHWEADQEAFLVVSGEAVLIIEGEERLRRERRGEHDGWGDRVRRVAAPRADRIPRRLASRVAVTRIRSSRARLPVSVSRCRRRGATR